MRDHLRKTRNAIGIAALVLVAACAENTMTTTQPVDTPEPETDAATAEPAMPAEKAMEEQTAPQPEPDGNVLLAEWAGPYGGTPPFDRMQIADVEPAFEAAMAMGLAEIDEIADNPEPPTFDNTIVEMERAGDDLSRVRRIWGVWRSNRSSPEVREAQQRVAPKLAQYRSKITQNQKLFDRIRAVYESEEVKSLSPEQQRLVRLVYEGFARNGATLEGEARQRYAEISQRLAVVHAQFGNGILADEEGYVVYLTEEQLGGLPESLVRAAAGAASERGREGEYAVTNTRSSMDPFLTFSDQRELREKVWRNYYSRGDNGDEHDNNARITEILQLRNERVRLLGYDSYAHWRLENRMAKTPEQALELMEAVWPAALARVAEEVADMQAIADAEGAGITIAPWDYRYYAEKVRQARFDLDSDEVKQYLQLGKLREAMFFVAGELFGFSFVPVPEGEVPVFHEDVKVWQVSDKSSGDFIGLWYLDPYARQGKRSGAWATSYRTHETFDGKKTVLVSNNSNFIKAPPGQPLLISWSDARTLFHEFGHALHTLSSKAAYPTLNGGVRDYTEFQSQLLERWLLTDEVIDNYLVHPQTGEPIPDELVAKIKKAATFNQGFVTTEYLACALMDMKYHTMDPQGLDADAFERAALAELGMPGQIPMRHRSPHFGHIFSSESYAAGYYGYMWADVLTSDAAEAFAKAPGGYYDKELAGKLVTHLFEPRNSVDPADAYRSFRGRDPEMEALMRDRGFPVPGE
jgi:peptidyl-dipeptidase Dcp